MVGPSGVGKAHSGNTSSIVTEKSKRSLTVRMKNEDDYGMNKDSNLSHSVRASIKEDSQ